MGCFDSVDACLVAGRWCGEIKIGMGRNHEPTRLPLFCYMHDSAKLSFSLGSGDVVHRYVGQVCVTRERESVLALS